jgi:hypothetical protein
MLLFLLATVTIGMMRSANASGPAAAEVPCIDHGFPYNSTLACQVRKSARSSACAFGNCGNKTGPHFCEGAWGKKYCCKTCSEPDVPAVGCRVPHKNAPCLVWECPLRSIQATGTSCTVRAKLDARCMKSCGRPGIVSSESGAVWGAAPRTCTPSGAWSLAGRNRKGFRGFT